MRTSAYAVAGLAALALGAAGCGSDNNNSDNSSASTPASTPAATPPAKSTPAAGGAGASTVTIGESEYKLTPSNATAKAGTVTIEAKNDGQIVHNLEVEGNGVSDKKTADIQPGSTGKITVNLKPGKYEMYCAIDGHKDLGMKGDITVS